MLARGYGVRMAGLTRENLRHAASMLHYGRRPPAPAIVVLRRRHQRRGGLPFLVSAGLLRRGPPRPSTGRGVVDVGRPPRPMAPRSAGDRGRGLAAARVGTGTLCGANDPR